MYEPDSQYFYVVGKGSNSRLAIALQEAVTKVSADIMITSSVTVDSYFDGDTYYVLTGIPIEYLTPAVNEAFEIIGEKVSE